MWKGSRMTELKSKARPLVLQNRPFSKRREGVKARSRPSVPEIAALAAGKGLDMDVHSSSFFLGRETLLPTGEAVMARWRKSLFALMSRNAWNVSSYFGIPPGRVIELGAQVEL